MKYLHILYYFLLIFVVGLSVDSAEIDQIAEDYVKLVLKVGIYDEIYVDAYYGPEDWRPGAADSSKEFDYELLSGKARGLTDNLLSLDTSGWSDMEKYRQENLHRLLKSVTTKIELVNGTEMSFDEESQGLFGFVEPVKEDEYYLDIKDLLDSLLPGEGDIADRYDEYTASFRIAPEDVDSLYITIMDTIRAISKTNIFLPEMESYDLVFSDSLPYRGFCEYLGGYKSEITINPNYVWLPDLLRLASHEMYPGHHTRVCQADNYLVQKNGWIELVVYPLFNFYAIIDEGLAVYAEEMVFTPEELDHYERHILCPMVGMDTTAWTEYKNLHNLIKIFATANNKVAREYLDGIITADSAVKRLETIGLVTDAQGYPAFYESLRSYMISYTLGYELVKQYIEEGSPTREERWERFSRLAYDPAAFLNLGK